MLAKFAARAGVGGGGDPRAANVWLARETVHFRAEGVSSRRACIRKDRHVCELGRLFPSHSHLSVDCTTVSEL